MATTLVRIDGQSVRKAIEEKGLTQAQISRIIGQCDSYTSNYLSNGKYSLEAIEKLKYMIGLDLTPFIIKDEPKPEPVKSEPQPQPQPITVLEPNYEPIITAIGQATAILSNQLSEVIKQLKTLNDSRDAELKTISSAMQRNLTDAMCSAVVLGIQESKNTISDCLRQAIKNSNKRF